MLNIVKGRTDTQKKGGKKEWPDDSNIQEMLNV